MKIMRILSLPALVLAIASPAFAQQPAVAPVGIYVAAQGGALIDPRTGPAFGVEVGDRVGRHTIVSLNVSYFDNVMNTALSDDLARLSQTLTARTGRAFSLTGRDRGVSLIAGAKYLVGTGTVKPYAAGGLGALAIRRRITERTLGDVTTATLREFGVGDADLATEAPVTRPLVEAGVGVDFDFGRTHVDLGYRWRRAFHLGAETADFTQVGLGIGINF